jgi:2,4-dienoyl-CoA reductase-like NADH-dependent reductase (Old Yellow Enzyme family)
MSYLFSPLTLRSLTLRNRIVMSPMAMYSAGEDGLATEWHRVHYGTRAVGGVGLILQEVTAVEARGRISRGDLGLWDDSQVEGLAQIVRFGQAQGAAMGVQLGHAGRKAWGPEKGHGPLRAIAPCAVPFEPDWAVPQELDGAEIERVIVPWRAAAQRALLAGFDIIELHAAHGYLLHQFLSPLTNHRTDEYGGSPEKRARMLLRVVEAVREVWPEAKPLFVRISATDWVDGGLTLEDHVPVARELKARGVDVVDCSSGGIVPAVPPCVYPGYQVPFAERIRRGAGIATQAVGLITTPEQAEEIVANGRADLVALGRELLRNPYWPLQAARALGHDMPWPEPYVRAKR